MQFVMDVEMCAEVVFLASNARADGINGDDAKVVLYMDKNLEMVAKEEPNVAFIIQRSNVSDVLG